MEKEKKEPIVVDAEVVEEETTDTFTPTFALDHTRLTKESIELAIMSNLEHMKIAQELEDMETAKRCNEIAFAYQDMLGQFNIMQLKANQEIARIALGAHSPIISEIYKGIALPEAVNRNMMTLQLTGAQDAINAGAKDDMSPEEVKNMFRNTMAAVIDGKVTYNPKRIEFYKKMNDDKTHRLNIIISNHLESGERDLAVDLMLRFFEEDPEHSFAVFDVDRYAIRKKAKEEIKNKLLKRDSHAMNWPAYKHFETEKSLETTKAPKDYWDSLSQEKKDEYIKHALTEKVESIDVIDYTGIDLTEEEKKELQPKVIGLTRIDILTKAELIRRAHRYIDRIKDLKSVKELCPQPKGFVVIVNIPDLKGDDSTTVAIRVTPRRVIIDKKTNKEGYIKYDKMSTVEMIASRMFSTTARSRMGYFKLNSLKEVIETDKAGLIEELGKVYPSQLGLWFNELQVVDFAKTAKTINELPQGGVLSLITAAIQEHYGEQVKAELDKIK